MNIKTIHRAVKLCDGYENVDATSICFHLAVGSRHQQPSTLLFRHIEAFKDSLCKVLALKIYKEYSSTSPKELYSKLMSATPKGNILTLRSTTDFWF